jgi:hypothetical protein
LEIATATVHKTAKGLTRSVARLRDELQALNPKDFVGEEALWQALERLFVELRKAFQAADRRLK